MENFRPRLVAVALSTSNAFAVSNPGYSVEHANQKLLVSAISEPEDGLIRSCFLEINDKNYINSFVIKDSQGHTAKYSWERLLDSEVTIAKVKGLDAVLLQVMSTTGNESLIKIRYLSRAPGEYKSFEFRARRDQEGQWAIYEKDRPRLFKWMLFRSRTFMGVTIGVDSYELSQEMPQMYRGLSSLRSV